MRSSHVTAALALLLPVVLGGCADDVATAPDRSMSPDFASVGTPSHAIDGHAVDGEIEAFFQSEMDAMNERLEAEGSNMRVAVAELLLAPDAPVEVGTTVYANNRTLQLSYIWVQGDERRDGREHLTYLVDESHSLGYTRTDYPAKTYLGGYFDASFAPWTTLQCNNAELVRVADSGVDPSYFDYPPFNDGATVWGLADIVVAGWRALPSRVLGVTYTWTFIDGSGKPTDVNGDGRRDTARTEIWYALGYYWTTNAVPGIDLLSVAIHENGHAVGLGHFGQIFRTNANGQLHFAPRAIMNAAYVSRMQELQGTDEASYCENYASWQ